MCKNRLYPNEPKSVGVFCVLEEGHEGLHKSVFHTNMFNATVSWPQEIKSETTVYGTLNSCDDVNLDVYMAAFLGTEQESIVEFEEAGIACWLNYE